MQPTGPRPTRAAIQCIYRAPGSVALPEYTANADDKEEEVIKTLDEGDIALLKTYVGKLRAKTSRLGRVSHGAGMRGSRVKARTQRS